LPKKIAATQGRRRAAAVHAAASQALGPILQPLAAFVLDSGLSVRELEVLFRTAAVLSVAARQRASGQRVNISGIAATTGIPRAEISQILRAPKRPAATRPLAPSPINRVLAAWHEEPGYQKPSGKPADLRVFGAAPSFEALAKKHGAGLPTRAILDELARAGACTTGSTGFVRLMEQKTSKFLTNTKISRLSDHVGTSPCHTHEALHENPPMHGLSRLNETHPPEFSSVDRCIDSLIKLTIPGAGCEQRSQVAAILNSRFRLLLAIAPVASSELDETSDRIVRKNLRRSSASASMTSRKSRAAKTKSSIR